ncbi:uncharacterized protein LOC130677726 [Microplitis mediator]|uniref:uncharacterized protein LOC130677726 n=1 Tax=Microplitis mediator TaxID=375433 RepID=UPI00255558F0|nr:uncharacterized protein LOC130677726 [Microplitis mediator]
MGKSHLYPNGEILLMPQWGNPQEIPLGHPLKEEKEKQEESLLTLLKKNIKKIIMDDNEESQVFSQTNDARKNYESLAIPGPSKQLFGNEVDGSKNNHVNQKFKTPIAPLKQADKTRSEPDLRFGKESNHQQKQLQQRDQQSYIRLQQHTLRLMQQEYEMRDKNILNVNVWFMIGKEYSNCCANAIKTVSENLAYLSSIKGLSEHLDVIEKERKFRLLSAYDLLVILRECLRRTCIQLDEIYQRSIVNVPACQQISFYNQDFKAKIGFVEQFITGMKRTMDVLFIKEVTKSD